MKDKKPYWWFDGRNKLAYEGGRQLFQVKVSRKKESIGPNLGLFFPKVPKDRPASRFCLPHLVVMIGLVYHPYSDQLFESSFLQLTGYRRLLCQTKESQLGGSLTVKVCLTSRAATECHLVDSPCPSCMYKCLSHTCLDRDHLLTNTNRQVRTEFHSLNAPRYPTRYHRRHCARRSHDSGLPGLFWIR